MPAASGCFERTLPLLRTPSQFGYSVSIDGDTAVISAPSANHHQRLTGFGGAYVFTRSGTTWTHRQTLTASESADLDAFGWAVSLSRDTVLVSRSGKRPSQGVVFVFTRSENFWTQRAMLTASDGAGRDVFGSRLSLDGDTAAIVSTQTLFIPGAPSTYSTDPEPPGHSNKS